MEDKNRPNSESFPLLGFSCYTVSVASLYSYLQDLFFEDTQVL